MKLSFITSKEEFPLLALAINSVYSSVEPGSSEPWVSLEGLTSSQELAANPRLADVVPFAWHDGVWVRSSRAAIRCAVQDGVLAFSGDTAGDFAFSPHGESAELLKFCASLSRTGAESMLSALCCIDQSRSVLIRSTLMPCWRGTAGDTPAYFAEWSARRYAGYDMSNCPALSGAENYQQGLRKSLMDESRGNICPCGDRQHPAYADQVKLNIAAHDAGADRQHYLAQQEMSRLLCAARSGNVAARKKWLDSAESRAERIERFDALMTP